MKKITASLFFIALLICSCEKTILSDSRTEIDANLVPIEKALELANFYLKNLDDSKTRSTSVRKVKSIKLLNTDKANTRAGLKDETNNLLYEINYENEKGFALIGANYDIYNIYAIGTEGNLNWSDTIDNKGLAMFYRNLTRELKNKLPKTKITLLYLPDSNNPKFIKKVGPFHHNYQWSQGEPFNNKCYTSTGERAKVGCGPIAVAYMLWSQVHPNETPGTLAITHLPDGTYIDWFKIANATSIYIFDETLEAITTLFSDLGKPQHLNVTYGVSATSTSHDAVLKFFRDCGFKCEGYKVPTNTFYRDYWNRSRKNLYIRGECFEGGHAWVNQGYAEIKDDNNIIKQYLYMNWGWGGKANAWYLAASEFDTSSAGSTAGAQYGEIGLDDRWQPNTYFFNQDILTLEISK